MKQEPPLVQKLRPHAEQIIADADAGEMFALLIIELYEEVRQGRLAAIASCNNAFNMWRKTKPIWRP
jgi:hypothetical protein